MNDCKAKQLTDHIAGYGSCLVAFSGGVDSSLVAKAAYLALDKRAIAVTGESFAVAAGEIEIARDVAQRIGIRHEVIPTAEFSNPDYTSNPTNRCYFCKDELYTRLGELLSRFGVAVIANGANLDDLGDHRPGIIAASEHRVRSPLAECGFTKQDVRELARYWDLPVWDKPASPCLASRVAYGEQVTPQRLSMIDRAEQYLREQGFPICRVRYRPDDTASVEVPKEVLPRLMEPESREHLVSMLKSLGFQNVLVDETGFRSGSLNEAIPAELLQIARRS